jgi:hypothetical protein
MASISESISVNALVSCSPSTHKWGSDIWQLVKIEAIKEQAEPIAHKPAQDCFLWPDLTLTLHSLHCETYYQNLMSGSPNVYLICKQTDGKLTPHFITVDYDEANSYTETGEQVLIGNLPEDLCYWLEKFVIENYQPEKLKKRQRKKWHDKSKDHDRKFR